MQDTIADKLIGFYQNLRPPKNLPNDIETLFPQKDPKVMELVKQFCKKFFTNNPKRRLMFGINPGRFGAGITGINFTAPKQLIEHCGITHHFKSSSELSAEFIYEMIAQYGGTKKFYFDWFISSVCPLGFIKENKNINYYDDKKLLTAVTPFITNKIQQQVNMKFNNDFCICVGSEKNFKFLSGLNEQYGWFQKIIPLPHPRFILQYRRKQKEKYIHQYLSALQSDS
jgi:hypothetical protein